ncbi:MAG: toll/interleukin-1 receptor domain-containing protein, partial [Candidatus Poribacteria bacterium]|nr:toll/interleukin-1 receptor domain-containing protein [Candidatus Poribacteria bacterium]
MVAEKGSFFQNSQCWRHQSLLFKLCDSCYHPAAMSDVFISYSGPDIDFVRHLFDQLTAHDREPWADWQDIPPTADWLAEIYGGIEAADSFLFIISPDSVASEICTLEIEHAVKHNKRLVPVVWKEVEDHQVHSAMTAHNWVFLRAEDDFEANFELLIDALDTDLAYIKEHTRLLTRAIEWQDNNRRRTDVLRGPELTAAEGWLTISQLMEP